jgi:Cell wall-active antibiotics response 4TMS YvqF
MRGRLALGVVALGAGIVWLLHAADVVELSYRVVVGLLLLAIGFAVVLVPTRRVPLVVLGILVALAGVPALVLDSEVFEGGVGEKTETPTERRELEPFRQAIGRMTVDLTSDELSLDGATVEASVGMGDLLVLLPEDTDVDLDVHVGLGNAEALGESENGFDVELGGLSSTSGSQEFRLEVDVGIGNARVQRP